MTENNYSGNRGGMTRRELLKMSGYGLLGFLSSGLSGCSSTQRLGTSYNQVGNNVGDTSFERAVLESGKAVLGDWNIDNRRLFNRMMENTFSNARGSQPTDPNDITWFFGGLPHDLNGEPVDLEGDLYNTFCGGLILRPESVMIQDGRTFDTYEAGRHDALVIRNEVRHNAVGLVNQDNPQIVIGETARYQGRGNEVIESRKGLELAIAFTQDGLYLMSPVVTLNKDNGAINGGLEQLWQEWRDKPEQRTITNTKIANLSNDLLSRLENLTNYDKKIRRDFSKLYDLMQNRENVNPNFDVDDLQGGEIYHLPLKDLGQGSLYTTEFLDQVVKSANDPTKRDQGFNLDLLADILHPNGPAKVPINFDPNKPFRTLSAGLDWYDQIEHMRYGLFVGTKDALARAKLREKENKQDKIYDLEYVLVPEQMVAEFKMKGWKEKKLLIQREIDD